MLTILCLSVSDPAAVGRTARFFLSAVTSGSRTRKRLPDTGKILAGQFTMLIREKFAGEDEIYEYEYKNINK